MRDKIIRSDVSDYSGRETLADLTEAQNYNNHLVDIILENVPADAKVLDFGAGNGFFTQKIAQHTSSILAVEPDPQLALEISKKCNVEVVALDQVMENSVDLIFSLNVLEHIKGDVEILKSLSEKLTPRGQILIYVPAMGHLYSKFDRRIGHYRRYTTRSLGQRATEAGLEVVSINFMDPVGYAAALYYRLFANTGAVSQSSIRFFDKFLYPASRTLTPLTKKVFGKNVLLIAKRKGANITI